MIDLCDGFQPDFASIQHEDRSSRGGACDREVEEAGDREVEEAGDQEVVGAGDQEPAGAWGGRSRRIATRWPVSLKLQLRSGVSRKPSAVYISRAGALK